MNHGRGAIAQARRKNMFGSVVCAARGIYGVGIATSTEGNSRLMIGGNLPVTEDSLLGGHVRLLQPALGLRATTATVLLAAAAPAVEGMMVLDAGSGTGATAFCLAARVSGLRLHGIEVDAELAELSLKNARLNRLDNWSVHVGDIHHPPSSLCSARFDIVVTNPPWQGKSSGPSSPDWRRKRAVREREPGLGGWMASAMRLVSPGGMLVAILPLDRLEVCVRSLGKTYVEVLPLAPRSGTSPKRVLIRAVPRTEREIVHLPALAVHEGLNYTEELHRVLWQPSQLPWPARDERTGFSRRLNGARKEPTLVSRRKSPENPK